MSASKQERKVPRCMVGQTECQRQFLILSLSFNIAICLGQMGKQIKVRIILVRDAERERVVAAGWVESGGWLRSAAAR